MQNSEILFNTSNEFLTHEIKIKTLILQNVLAQLCKVSNYLSPSECTTDSGNSHFFLWKYCFLQTFLIYFLWLLPNNSKNVRILCLGYFIFCTFKWLSPTSCLQSPHVSKSQLLLGQNITRQCPEEPCAEWQSHTLSPWTIAYYSSLIGVYNLFPPLTILWPITCCAPVLLGLWVLNW